MVCVTPFAVIVTANTALPKFTLAVIGDVFRYSDHAHTLY